MNWVARIVQSLIAADRRTFYWFKKKLDASDYQMAVLGLLKGTLIGLFFGWLLY